MTLTYLSMAKLGNLLATRSAQVNENLYAALFRFSLSPMNIHVGWHTLHASDQDFYVKPKNRLDKIGEETTFKGASAQANYRNKRRRRMEVQLRGRTTSHYPSDDQNQSE